MQHLKRIDSIFTIEIDFECSKNQGLIVIFVP